jgi:hypothetical protein
MNMVPLMIGWSFLAVIGATLLVRARQLSLSYNAWTTRLRERHPNINPPPTPKMRELNTQIMKWMFRVMGVFLFLLSIVAMMGIWRSN